VPFDQLDSSAIVKRYVPEVGCQWLTALVAPESRNVISIAEVTRAEVAGALTRRAREGSLPFNESRLLIQAFEAHCAMQYRVIPTEHAVVSLAVELIQQHPLRTYDAIQLATALIFRGSLAEHSLPPPTFISADDRLLAAAQAEGLPTDNPNDHP
jgi:uncharacterized protein